MLDTDIRHEAEMIESIIRRAASPVHLIGHSFGGLCALAVALRNKVPLLSLTIVEAPVMELLRQMEEYQKYRAQVRDPDFIADVRKTNVELDPLPGDRVQELIARTLNVPPAVRERAKLAFGR